MNTGLWLLTGSFVGLAAMSLVSLICWKREQRRHERTALLANEYLATLQAHIRKDEREAAQAAKARQLRVIAFPGQGDPSWGSTFPNTRTEMN